MSLIPKRGVVRAALVACVLFAGASSLAAIVAKPQPSRAQRGNERMIDARINSPAAALAAASRARAPEVAAVRAEVQEMAAARAALQRSLPGLEVKMSPTTLGPEQVRNRAGALTAAAPGRTARRSCATS